MTINKLNLFWLQIAENLLIYEIRIIALTIHQVHSIHFYSVDILNWIHIHSKKD